MLKTRALALTGIGWSLGFWIGGGAILGHWLDGKYGIEPVLTVALLFLGLAIGLYDAYRRLKELVVFNNDKNGN
ncbi:MAG: AtpZ/AtpI family protein [Chloroflexota bacterium]